MSLLTYEDARKYARRIKTKVSDRLMPPWHIDKTVGIQAFKNDRSLSDREVETIVRWVDEGTPAGDPKDMPPPADLRPSDEWQFAPLYGKPDLVHQVAVRTRWRPARRTSGSGPSSETGLTEPRWVRAIEIKPVGVNGRRTVHHVLTTLQQQEDGITGLADSAHDHQTSAGLFMEWAVGKTGEIFPADAGKLMLPGSRIRWEIHMFAIGEEMKDNEVELGHLLLPEGRGAPAPDGAAHVQRRAPDRALDIPPNKTAMTQNFYVMQAPARIENFQPHMHMRGKAMSMEAIYPDGRREVLSHVDKFQWNWHVNYVYADTHGAAAAQGDRARVHGVARQHGGQSQQPRSEAVGRLGRSHRRRDGARLGGRDLPQSGRLSEAVGGEKSQEMKL